VRITCTPLDTSDLLSTGCRKGEALGLRWEDLDFSGQRVLIRRALIRGRLGTPKSGTGRTVVLAPSLANVLLDLLSERRQACLKRGWSRVPELVFCSAAGGPLDERNVGRTWKRREAQAAGVRPLRLHDAWHTFASLALASGKSVRWVASQLGHTSPELTLRVYAHALREEEQDLSFLDFDGTRRHPRGTRAIPLLVGCKAPAATMRRATRNVARREGLEPPTLRFEA
jgi:integrase